MWEHLKLLQKIEDISRNIPSDDGLASHLARHSCLLGCAALEVGLKELVLEYVKRRSCNEVVRYARSQLDYLNNPKPHVIVEVLRKFDPAWAISFEAFIDDGGRAVRESLGSLVGQRNLIAHGRNSDVSFGRLKPWLADAKASLGFIEKDILIL